MSLRKSGIPLYLSFFLSGAAALILENLWAKYLALAFGSTAYAHALVLAIFMGGMTAGSVIFGKLADKTGQGLRLYSWMQLGTALFSLFTPKMFMALQPVYLNAVQTTGGHTAVVILLRVLFSATVMLLPSVLMGGTLPALAREIAGRNNSSKNAVAGIYFINNAGAVVGSLSAGFILTAWYGLEFTVTIASALIFAAWLLALAAGIPGNDAPASAPAVAAEEPPAQPLIPLRAIKIAIFISGLAAMIYELAWIRVFAIILGSSTYSFALMLAAFISGLTAGSAIATKARFKNPARAFATCQLAIALVVLFSVPFYSYIPKVFLILSSLMARTADTFYMYEFLKFTLCFAVMALPTVFFGLAFPLAVDAAGDGVKKYGEDVGSLYAWDTAGSIIGALAAGLILMPLLGLQNLFGFGALLNLTAGAYLLALGLDRKRQALIAAATIPFAAIYVYAVPEWDTRYFCGQVFRRSGGLLADNAFDETGKTIFKKDGAEDSVYVTDSGTSMAMYINGKVDATTSGDMETQILLGELPLLLKPDAERICVIGLGSGVTAGSVLKHPVVALDAVEISPEVAKASRLFDRASGAPLNDRRTVLHIDDANSFLAVNNVIYDAIISEPSNPWISGIGNLFSDEFYALCNRRLSDSGVLVQWIQGYETDPKIFRTVITTLKKNFPYVTLWSASVPDLIVIASKQPLRPDFSALAARFDTPAIRADMERIGIKDTAALLSMQTAAARAAADPSPGQAGRINSVFFPVIEYHAPQALFLKSSLDNFIPETDERRLSSCQTGTLLCEFLKTNRLTPDNYASIFSYLHRSLQWNRALLPPLLYAWKKNFPADSRADAAEAMFNSGDIAVSEQAYSRLLAGKNGNSYLDGYSQFLFKRYITLRSVYTPEIAADTIRKMLDCAEKYEGDKSTIYYRLGKVYMEERDYKNALEMFLKGERAITAGASTFRDATLFNSKAFCYIQLGNRDEAVKNINQAIALDPKNMLSREYAAAIAAMDTL